MKDPSKMPYRVKVVLTDCDGNEIQRATVYGEEYRLVRNQIGDHLTVTLENGRVVGEFRTRPHKPR